MSTLILTNNPFLMYNPQASDLREDLEVPELNVLDYLSQQEIPLEDSVSQLVLFTSSETSSQVSEDSIRLSSLQSMIRSQQWLFPVVFQVAVGTSFVTYFAHQYRTHRMHV